MTRTYDSSGRKAAAARTRESLVEAGVTVHGKGVTTLAAVAEEAGVSLPTLYKHFPRREDLFEACTSHLASSLEYPDREELAAIANRSRRLKRIAEAASTLNEQTTGQAWTAYRLAGESGAMSEAMQAYEEFIRQLAEAIFGLGKGDQERDSNKIAFASALLGPLTYRAARIQAGMDQHEISNCLAHSLEGLLRSRKRGPSGAPE